MNGRIISLVIADLVCIRLAVIAGICQSWTARLPPPLQCLLLSVYNGRTARKLFSVFCISRPFPNLPAKSRYFAQLFCSVISDILLSFCHLFDILLEFCSASERVFSLLNHLFSSQQDSAETIEATIMARMNGKNSCCTDDLP